MGSPPVTESSPPPPSGTSTRSTASTFALSAGAATVLLPAFTPPDLARTLDAEAVTVLFAAPAHVAACLGAGLLTADGLSRLRLAVLSGSAVAPAVARELQERMANGHVTQLWGMTETQAGLYTRPGDSHRDGRRNGRPAQPGHGGPGRRCGRCGATGR